MQPPAATLRAPRPLRFLFNSLRPHIVVAVVVTACARPAAYPPQFTGGQYGSGNVSPSDVRELRTKPSEYAMLGQVQARCRADEGVRSIRDAWLADVDCSDELLTAALREKAAAVGGQALIGRVCTHDEHSCGRIWRSTLITCAANVAGQVAAPDVAESRAHPPGEYESPSQAFRVKVSFAPLNRASVARAPREPDRVKELAVFPPTHIEMGDITARCRGECERAAVRYAVRAAAGRVGATDVAGIACITTQHGFACTGRAARPEADPETNLLAR